MRNLLVGVAVGVAAGWLVFDLFVRSQDASPRSDREAPAKDGDHADAGGRDAASGDGTARSQPPPDVAALAGRLEEARRAGDWPRFRGILLALGTADTLEAHRKLVAIIGDTSIRFPLPMGQHFARWLANSTAPGIADAARTRFSHNIAAGETSWVAADGWLDLVAAHGTAADLRWLSKRDESGQIRSEALESIAKAPTADAAALVAELFREGRIEVRHLREFVKVHPDDAFRMLDHEMVTRVAPFGFRDVAVAYADAARGDTLGRARERLLALDHARRIEAVYAVAVLARKGLDIAGLEPVLEAPLVTLAEATPDTPHDRMLLGQALSAIEHNDVTWNARTLEMLKASAVRLGTATPDFQARLQKVIRQIDARLASGWRK